MLTMLRWSCSAAAFRACLKLGDTLRFKVSLFTSLNFILPRKCLCICGRITYSKGNLGGTGPANGVAGLDARFNRASSATGAASLNIRQ